MVEDLSVTDRRPTFIESGTMSVRSLKLCAVLCACVVAGCATVPSAGVASGDQNDPFESFNRGVFSVNQSLDRAVIKPVAKAYRSALPEPVRDSIRSFVDNLSEPLVFANDLLQGRGAAAGITGRRFIINSTWGVVGLFDKAADRGMPRQSGDFGQTLFSWGFVDGPYLMLPLFGPSNIRDALGMGVDAYAAPLGHVGSHATRRTATASVGITGGIDERSRNIETLEGIEASSVDFYAYLRSVWRQNRQATLREAREAREDTPDNDLLDPGAPASRKAP